jgi:hypothetical protein
VVENRALLHTYTGQQSKIRQASWPVRAALELHEGVRLDRGKHHREIGHSERHGDTLEGTDIPADNPADIGARLECEIQALTGAKTLLKSMSERRNSLTRQAIFN